MKPEIQQKLERLAHLAHTAQNKKIVLEEIRLVSAEAFDLQDNLMEELDVSQALETDIKTVQELFEIRELVWDTVNQIALREKEIKEAYSSRESFQAHQKKSKETKADSCKCGCSHSEETPHCHHHSSENCAHQKDDPSHKCCHGKKKCCCHHG